MTDTSSPDHEPANGPAANQPSDARIILGPLVKHAAVGLVIVIIIVTTAVMLDRQFNTIDQEVAALQAQLSGANLPRATEAVEAAATTATPVQSNVPAVEPESAPMPAEAAEQVAVPQQPGTAVQPVSRETDDAEADAIASVDEPVSALQADGPAVDTEAKATGSDPVNTAAPLRSSTQYGFFEWPPMEAFIAERDAYLRERDRMYLEGHRASRHKQLQLMRDRLARQERRIEEMDRRYQEMDDVRGTDMREWKEMRDGFLPDRI